MNKATELKSLRAAISRTKLIELLPLDGIIHKSAYIGYAQNRLAF